MIRNFFYIITVSLYTVCSVAQTTVTFKPGPEDGIDANLQTTYGCTSSAHDAPWETQPSGSHVEINCVDWTLNQLGCNRATIRGLIRFADLDTFINKDVDIVNATLRLFTPPNSLNGNYGNSYPDYLETNEGYVRRVTSAWDETNVTWNTAPISTSVNEAEIPYTTSRFNWIAEIDVTNLVEDILTAQQNYGFLLGLKTETLYRALLFASSDHPNSSLWPELSITYNENLHIAGNQKLNRLSTNVTPNPTTQDWRLIVNSPSTTEVYISLTDVTGKLVHSGRHIISGGDNMIELKTGPIPSGTYYLQIKDNEASTVKKLLKL